MPGTKRLRDSDPDEESSSSDFTTTGGTDSVEEEVTPTKIAKNESLSINELHEERFISDWITFRVELILPVKHFEHQTPKNLRYKRKSEVGRLYKVLLSDGNSCTMEGLSYDDIGESIMKQFKEDKVYSVKGKIEVVKRNLKYISEANSEFSLTFRGKLAVYLEKDHENKWKAYGSTIQAVQDRIRRDENFITRLNGITLMEGKLYRYWGCGLCKTSIRHPNPEDGKFYCSSELEPCRNDSSDRERKLFMIIKNGVLKESADAEEGLHDVVLWDDQCKDLLERKAEELGDDDISAQEFVDKVLNNAKLDIKIQVKKDSENYIHVTVDKILSKNLSAIVEMPTIENDQDDAEPFEDSSVQEEGDNSVDEEDEVPNLVNLTITDSQVENPRDKTCVYDLTSEPQALVLLINNHNFKNKYGHPEPPRRGSETDVINVKDTFVKLGCEIFEGGFFDVTLQELKTTLERFKAEVVKRKTSSIFVIVMSHGNSQEVQLVDGNMINMWTDIVYQFNDTNFKEFRGNPKIFIFQTCQTFPLTNHSSLIKPQNGTTSDVLVALPNIPGYTSKRNKRGLGSWYIYYLTQVLRERASSTEFVDMLGEVQRRLKAKTEKVLLAKKQSAENVLNSQISTWKPILFNKYYFKVPPQGTETQRDESLNATTT